ncbi:MAG: Transposase DDE domain protein [Bacillota bacterium]|nr:MAG: Transposase DDE domain protein [Bacillota bacterium]
MVHLCKPTFEDKDYGRGAGIPVLKTIWELIDLSLLFSQTGIRKHSGIASWILAFAYICGLIGRVGSANENAKFSADAPFLHVPWLKFSLGRLSRLQERTESRLTDGDIIVLDDTKVEHPHGKMIPFLCWLFDSSEKRHVWCMNLVSTLAVVKNGLEYPMLWRFWVKADENNARK